MNYDTDAAISYPFGDSHDNHDNLQKQDMKDDRIPDIDAIAEAEYEMKMGGIEKEQEQDDSWMANYGKNGLW